MQANEYPAHPMRIARVEKGLTQDELAQEIGLGVSTIRRAEQWFPLNLKTQRILSNYFKKTPKELGLQGRGWTQDDRKAITPQPTTLNPSQNLPIVVDAPAPLAHIAAPSPHYTPTQAIDLLVAQPNTVTDQHAGAWLALGTSHLAQLFEEGWSLENILNSLRIVMQGAQGIPTITRRKLLQLSGTAMVNDITLPTGEHVSEEEKVRITDALGKSIGDGWNLFQTGKIGVPQVIAVAQTQLALIKQAEHFIAPVDCSAFLSAIYRTTGMGFLLQGRCHKSLKHHQIAHIAALESGDLSSIVQSLLCKANSYYDLKQHADAAQLVEMAFRLTEHQPDMISSQSKAHILGFWADNAMQQEEYVLAQKKLNEIAAYLDQINPNGEFDRASWLSLHGKYALTTRDYPKAIQFYEQAMLALLPDWMIGQILTLIPLMTAYACKGERDKGLATAKKTLEALQVLNSAAMNRLFIESAEHALLATCPNDKEIQTFLTDVRHM
ncbi:MAG: helix-turn-helix domain-containing protein [Ktedonobacteraceae bacterium]